MNDGSTKPLIIIPGVVSDFDLELRRRYATDEEVRLRADDIHEHRMLPPPTCDDCIELAIAELNQNQQ
jgi:hypothetical protein